MKSKSLLQFSYALLTAGALFFASCGRNNTNSEDNVGSKEYTEEVNSEKFSDDTEKDADRLVKAYCTNMYEIKASEQATTKATTTEVKNLATMMVQAHTKMNTDIQGLAGRKNITLPTDLTDDLNKKMEDLNDENGLNYDKKYAQEMKDKHEDAANMLERMAEKSEDAEIKQWANNSLAEIRAHLDMVNATLSNIKDVKKDQRNNIDHTHDGRDDIHDHKH
jgi:putative membrane protein